MQGLDICGYTNLSSIMGDGVSGLTLASAATSGKSASSSGGASAEGMASSLTEVEPRCCKKPSVSLILEPGRPFLFVKNRTYPA